MNRSLLVSMLAVALAACAPAESPESTQPAAASELNGPDVFARTIAYHDPAGAWDSFSGSVRLVTARADGTTSGLEYIHVDKAAGLYRSVRKFGDDQALRQVSDGTCSASVNGNPNPTPEEIERFNLSCEMTLSYGQHHPAHIGFPMQARAAGVTVEEEVSRSELEGRPVLMLTIAGDSTRVTESYWADGLTLFVDPVTYAMRGYEWASNGTLWLLSGELEVGGVKMPQVKRVYAADGSLQFTDVFTHIEEWDANPL